jgi:hypothetical protein
MKTSPAQYKANKRWRAKTKKNGWHHWNVYTTVEIIEALKKYYQELRKIRVVK